MKFQLLVDGLNWFRMHHLQSKFQKNPNAKLSTSSSISEKPISSTFVSLMKHGHGQLGNHIIMVPLRILIGGGGYFYELLMALYIFKKKLIWVYFLVWIGWYNAKKHIESNNIADQCSSTLFSTVFFLLFYTIVMKKIIRFYYLYEILRVYFLKENIVNIWGKLYLTTNPK